MLVPCAHFHKQVYSTFGIPFFARVKHHEPFQAFKDRLQKKLDIPDKEWEKVTHNNSTSILTLHSFYIFRPSLSKLSKAKSRNVFIAILNY